MSSLARVLKDQMMAAIASSGDFYAIRIASMISKRLLTLRTLQLELLSVSASFDSENDCHENRGRSIDKERGGQIAVIVTFRDSEEKENVYPDN